MTVDDDTRISAVIAHVFCVRAESLEKLGIFVGCVGSPDYKEISMGWI